jgi:hypothetical protein
MLGPGLLAGTLLDRVLQDSFLHHVAVRVLNPGLVADRSQVLDRYTHSLAIAIAKFVNLRNDLSIDHHARPRGGATLMRAAP